MATAHVLDQIRGTPERPREWGIMVLDEVFKNKNKNHAFLSTFQIIIKNE
jgi:hypothetical protein